MHIYIYISAATSLHFAMELWDFKVDSEFASLSEVKLPLFKLSSITTYGVAAMMGRTSGFIALC